MCVLMTVKSRVTVYKSRVCEFQPPRGYAWEPIVDEPRRDLVTRTPREAAGFSLRCVSNRGGWVHSGCAVCTRAGVSVTTQFPLNCVTQHTTQTCHRCSLSWLTADE